MMIIVMKEGRRTKKMTTIRRKRSQGTFDNDDGKCKK